MTGNFFGSEVTEVTQKAHPIFREKSIRTLMFDADADADADEDEPLSSKL